MMAKLRYWLAVVAAVLATTPAATASPTKPHVLRVGYWKGVAGSYRSIQSAVDAARPGDWILVGPGDWRGRPRKGAGLYITTPGIHVRGMDRNTVIVDGTKSGRPCTSDPNRQHFASAGLNGIEVYKANGVSIENLTACNFLANADAKGGNQIWFNGGDGSGRVGLGTYRGRYLTATSTYYKDSTSPMATYGVFSSNAGGPGLWQDVYAANMGDAAVYVGACPDCNAVLDHVHGTHSSNGYSGTNSGGHLVIQNSEFDHNRVGIGPNSLNNDDAPSPQDGACPGEAKSPLTEPKSCTVIRRNHVHHNNDTDVPRSGLAGQVPPGIGIIVLGGKDDTIRDNLIDHNGAAGVAVVDWPDTETAPPVAHCGGGTAGSFVGSGLCYFVADGNRVLDNRFNDNGFYGFPGAGDLVNETTSVVPGNCFAGNTDPAGVTSDPPALQTLDGACGGPDPAAIDPVTLALSICGTGILQANGSPVGCSGISHVTAPSPSPVTMWAMSRQRSMPNPCKGVPRNPWC